MMRLYSEQEISDRYVPMFKRVFGYEPTGHVPRVVIAEEKEDSTSFTSGYFVTTDTFYISWAGATGGFKAVRRMWTSAEEEMMEAGVKWFTLKIENTNTQAQRLVLGIGFIPVGITVSGTKIYIEYHKRLIGDN